MSPAKMDSVCAWSSPLPRVDNARHTVRACNAIECALHQLPEMTNRTTGAAL